MEDLLHSGSGVNDVDSGGGTAMHLIAVQGTDDSLCEKITSSLLQTGATLGAKKRLLDWTPLHYARQTGNRYVEQLLSGLSVRQQDWI